MTKIGIRVRVSAIIFNNKKLIITKHFVKGYGEYYLLPGGGLEKGESPIDALKRECKEEIGINIKVNRLIYYKTGYNDTDTYLELIFLCESETHNFYVSNNEKNVKEISYIKDEKELSKIRFFPKQIVNKIFKRLPKSPEFLGKFSYPEN